MIYIVFQILFIILGLGSNPLQKNWMETFVKLLGSKKPILLTAHSAYDLARDQKYINKLISDENMKIIYLIKPCLNPFASFRKTFDINEHPDAQIITTNQYIYSICLI